MTKRSFVTQVTFKEAMPKAVTQRIDNLLINFLFLIFSYLSLKLISAPGYQVVLQVIQSMLLLKTKNDMTKENLWSEIH